jgi:succinate dehydrogenase / fumarate reductase cytochrome b subunit
MTKERPLSPHLQIYSPQITSVLSILHRATGVALTLGLFVVTWWLLAAASGSQAYDTFRHIVGSPIGFIFMIGWSYALFYHACAGIRHLFLDAGKFYTIPEIYKSGYVLVTASVVATAVFWYAILF